jgi:uncharacterized membrane protein YheB (UPF0754 family)
VGVKTLKYQLGEGVNGYLSSSGFEEMLAAALADRLDELADQEINSLVAPDNRHGFYLFIDEVLRVLLRSEQTAPWLAGHVAASLRQAAAAGRTVGDVLPEPLTGLVRTLLRTHAGPILQRLGTQVSDPVLRTQVIAGILAGVDHFLANLGPVGAMARGFLEVDTLEQKVGAYLEEKKDDLVVWLGNPEVQERLTAVLGETVDALLHKRLDLLLADVADERLTHFCLEGTTRLLAACTGEGALTGLRALLHVGMENLLDGGRRPLGNLADQFFPNATGQKMRETIVRECLHLFRSASSERLVHTMVGTMVDGLLARPLGRLYDIVPHGVRQGLIEYVVLSTNRMLLQEVPGVVESLNLKRIVIDKVDSLNLLQLERLLLSIMEEQFKYINLFGAILGFIIGLFNLALAQLI